MGIVARLAAVAAAVARPLVGRADGVAGRARGDGIRSLRGARWRRGGLPVRVGGWCLGQATVSAITLWRTIWLAPDVRLVTRIALA